MSKEPKKKKTKSGKGPTLIRNLSQTDKPKDIDGMVYNPEHKMWDGNNDILEEFEDHEPFFSFPAPPAVPAPTPLFPSFPHPQQQQHQRPSVCQSPSVWSASTITRPALISNMNHCSSGGPRPQMSGKMIFDPVSMSWRINPAYLALRRVKRRIKNPNDDASDLDDAWGDEPNVFEGLSDDSDKSDDDDEEEDDDDSNDDNDVGDDAENDQSGHDDRGDGEERRNDPDTRRVVISPTAVSAVAATEESREGEDDGAGLMDEADDGMLSEIDEEDEPKPVLKDSSGRRRGSGGRKSRYGSIRLQIPPGFASEDLSTIDKDDAIIQSLAMWSEQPLEPMSATPTTPTMMAAVTHGGAGAGGNFGSIRGGYPLLRSVESKPSRKSLRACLAANGVLGGGGIVSGGIPNGGGYSSRDEFEVGLEFDITDKFLEECLAAEAQHRRDAGRFFALPCSPGASVSVSASALPPPPAAAVAAAAPVMTIKARLGSMRTAPANVDKKKKDTLPKKIKQATLKGLFGGDKSCKKDQAEVRPEHEKQPQSQEKEQEQPSKQATKKKKSLMSLGAMIKGNNNNKSPGATLALGETAVAKPLHRRLPLPEAFRKQKAESKEAPLPASRRNSRQQQENPPQLQRLSSESSHGTTDSTSSSPHQEVNGNCASEEGPVPSMSKFKRSFTFRKKKGNAAKAKTLGHAAAQSIQQQQPSQSRDAPGGGGGGGGGGKGLLTLFSGVSTPAGAAHNGGDANGGYQTHFCNNNNKVATTFDEKTKTVTMTTTTKTPQRLSYAATLAIVRRGEPYGAKALRDTAPLPPLAVPGLQQGAHEHEHEHEHEREPQQEQEQEQEQGESPDSSTSSGSMTGNSSVGIVDLKQLAMNSGAGDCDGAGVGGEASTYANGTSNGDIGGGGGGGGHHLAMNDDFDDEAYESDQMERGYRVQSSARGRPPPHRLADILREFERATVAREQQQKYLQQLKRKSELQQQQQQILQQAAAVVVAAKQLS
ncbi:hypothetical protein DFQ26_007810 [Actinomortierella ambigua]|nr:hypothetical protein DFQ26_007810 [Actinomortierella ambigua]